MDTENTAPAENVEETAAPDQTQFLTDLYHSLSAFYANSHVPATTEDIKGTWIINEEEHKAISVVLEILADAGAETVPESEAVEPEAA